MPYSLLIIFLHSAVSYDFYGVGFQGPSFSGFGSRVRVQALEVALFKYIWFFIFQIKMQNGKRTSNLNFNINFENGKTILFYVLCLNFSIEAKIKSLFLILISIYQKTKSYFRYTDYLYRYSLTLSGWGEVLI